MTAAFTWRDLLQCYARGVFPMAESRDDPRVFVVDPEQRGVLPLDERFHVPKRLARTVRAEGFQVRIDTAFPAVLEACAETRAYSVGTWINAPIQALYGELYGQGFAHSVECWLEGRLVGGLYGVSLGAAFFGESMFSVARDASKVALVHLVARLRSGGYRLLDSQFLTEHLAQFGAEEVGRAEYRRRLDVAVERRGDFYSFAPSATGAEVLQAISQAS